MQKSVWVDYRQDGTLLESFDCFAIFEQRTLQLEGQHVGQMVYPSCLNGVSLDVVALNYTREGLLPSSIEICLFLDAKHNVVALIFLDNHSVHFEDVLALDLVDNTTIEQSLNIGHLLVTLWLIERIVGLTGCDLRLEQVEKLVASKRISTWLLLDARLHRLSKSTIWPLLGAHCISDSLDDYRLELWDVSLHKLGNSVALVIKYGL